MNTLFNVYLGNDVKCAVCKNSIENCLVMFKNGTLIHDNCANNSPLKQLQLKCEEHTNYIKVLTTEAELNERKISDLINQLESQNAHIQVITAEAELRKTTTTELIKKLESKCEDLTREIELAEIAECIGCEIKNMEISELETEVKELKEKIQIFNRENLIQFGQIAELKYMNEDLQQQRNKKKFIDKFKGCLKKNLGIRVNKMLLHFCSAILNIKFKNNQYENITIHKIITTVTKATSSEFDLHMFFEQLSYALVCKVCYLNSSCMPNNLRTTCKNHQAVLVDFNGIYYGGIFIGYGFRDESKAIIQWFENNFSLMDINKCFELPSSSTDESVLSAIAYNEKRNKKNKLIKFPKAESYIADKVESP